MNRKYILEILWDNGALTETSITERQKNMIMQYEETYILVRYELEGEPEAKPVSFQVWDEEDNPLFPLEEEKVPA